MRKSTLLFLFVTLAGITVAQNNGYLRFNAGFKKEDSPLLMLEVGKSFGWLDAGISLNYANNYLQYPDPSSSTSISTYISGNAPLFALEGKMAIDIIKMFAPDIRHSLRVGAGVGVAHDSRTYHRYNYDLIKSGSDSPIAPYMSLLANYEYRFMEKSWVGLFITSDLFANYLGISIRRDF